MVCDRCEFVVENLLSDLINEVHFMGLSVAQIGACWLTGIHAVNQRSLILFE